MSALIDGNPKYQNVTVMKVNWDDHKRDEIVSELGIRRRSTLVMFNEGKEVDRVIAQTSTQAIEALFAAVASS